MVQRVFGSAGVNLSPFPAVDVRDEKDRYVIEVELPGFTQSDVDIQIKDNVLTIASVEETVVETTSVEETAGEAPVVEVTADESAHENTNVRRPRRMFCRRFTLPKDVNHEAIEAAFTNGLLIINLNKQPEAQPRKIEIQVN